jgi:hypothetical protein
MLAKLITAIRRRPTFWTVVSAIFFAATFYIVSQKDKCLRTDFASRGIVSLELALKEEKANRILEVWSTTSCATSGAWGGYTSKDPESLVVEQAKSQTLWDCLFIPAYVLLIIVFIARRKINKEEWLSPTKTLRVSYLVMIAGLLDYFENVFLYLFLDLYPVPNLLFAVPAALKFLLLAIAIAHCLWKRFSQITDFTRDFALLLWLNRVAVIGLFIVYAVLWKVDQGQDLLLNLNAHDVGVGSFYFVLAVLAVVNWHFPKFLNDRTPPTEATPFLHGIQSNVPRILGIATFIIPACGILNALVIMKAFPAVVEDPGFFDLLPMALFLITMAFFVVAFERDWFVRLFAWLCGKKPRSPYAYYGLIGALLAAIVLFRFLNSRAPQDLVWLTIGLYCLAFAFAMIVSLRRYPAFYKGKLEKLYGRKANGWIVGAGATGALIFIIANFIPVLLAQTFISRFITMPVVFTGIVFYTLFFYGLLIRGKIDNINWSGIVIIIAILMAVIVDNKFHDVYRVKHTSTHKYETIQQYIKGWVKNREEAINSLPKGKKYPIYIVNSYGGGIRAAAWTSLVVGHLDSITHGEFQKHVLAYSGASGGTVGASVMCAVRKARPSGSFNPSEVVKFYENDFLTPVLIGLLGRDVFFSTTGWDAIEDRARLQDHTWEEHLNEFIKEEYYQSEFSSLWYNDKECTKRDYNIPLLFANTYHVEKGLKAILAPVAIDNLQFPEAVVVNEKLNGMSIPFSTGAFLSARFPYISPAGKIDNDHHFLDGGLKENSGAETAAELFSLMRKIKAEKDDWDSLYSRLDIYFVSLNNSGNHDRASTTTSNLVEVTAPFTALYNNWVGNTLRADAILRAEYKNKYLQFRPLRDSVVCNGTLMEPVLPLGWQISSCALQRMKEGLIFKANIGQTDSILVSLGIKQRPLHSATSSAK